MKEIEVSMEDKLYSVKQLESMYGIDRKTLLKWQRELGFPLFAISPNKRYARQSDLLNWEKKFKSADTTKSN
jgi:hypothetical protein